MNKIRITELQSRKLEAQQKIEYLETYTSGRELCNVLHEIELIEKNKQCIINIDGLIKKLSSN